MRESKKRERDEKPASNKPGRRTQSRVGPPPPVRSLFVAHSVEDWVPDVGSDIGTHVFVEAFAGSGVVASYFKSFADFKVVCEAPFLFALHILYGGEVFLVKAMVAVLIVLSDSRVMPLLFLNCF